MTELRLAQEHLGQKEECENCVFFGGPWTYPKMQDAAICTCTTSDHFQHLVTKKHPACREFNFSYHREN